MSQHCLKGKGGLIIIPLEGLCFMALHLRLFPRLHIYYSCHKDQQYHELSRPMFFHRRTKSLWVAGLPGPIRVPPGSTRIPPGTTQVHPGPIFLEPSPTPCVGSKNLIHSRETVGSKGVPVSVLRTLPVRRKKKKATRKLFGQKRRKRDKKKIKLTNVAKLLFSSSFKASFKAFEGFKKKNKASKPLRLSQAAFTGLNIVRTSGAPPGERRATPEPYVQRFWWFEPNLRLELG